MHHPPRTSLRPILVAASLLITAVVCLISSAPTHGQAAAGGPPSPAALAGETGELLVKFAGSAPATMQVAIHQSARADAVTVMPRLGVALVRLQPGASAEAALAAYRAQPGVLYAERNGPLRAAFVPNDSQYAQQWGLPKISAPAAWDITTGAASAKIAVLDTGIDPQHPEFAGRLQLGINTVDPGAAVVDGNGHGTQVAGIAAAQGNNRQGVAGVAWQNQVLVVKVLDHNGNGTDATVADGIRYATDNGARVINLSLGGVSRTQTMADAVQYALDHNVVLVAAAGNTNSQAVECPACYAGVIAVASTDRSDAKSSFSNYGPGVTIAAPGEGIVSTAPATDGSYRSFTGTSAATPFVAGAAALLLSVDSTLTPTQVRERLAQSADAVPSPALGAGRLNVGAAVGGLPPPPTTTPTATVTSTPCSRGRGSTCGRATSVPCGRHSICVTPSPTGTGTSTVTATPCARLSRCRPSPAPALLPMTVTGLATIAGVPAPSGSVITASIGGVLCGSTTVSSSGGRSQNFVLVVNSAAQTPGCGAFGASVTYQIDGVTAFPISGFISGGTLRLNLAR